MSETFVIHKDHPGREGVYRNMLAFLGRIFAACNRSYKVEITEYKKTRSTAQNHALFGVAYPALERATGYTKDELHTAFCRRFFGTTERDVVGVIVSVPYRTTTTNAEGKRDVLDARQFSEFYDLVQQVGAEAGIHVPSPDPFWMETNGKPA